MKKRSNGEGTIYFSETMNMWIGQIIIGKNSNGKSIRKSVYGSLRKDVVKKLSEIQSKVFKGAYYEPSKMTLEQWLYNWVETYKIRRWRTKTKELYRMLIRTIIIPFMGKMKISDIKPIHIQELVNKMHDDGYSYSTIEKIKNILRPAFEVAVINKYISDNPFFNIQLPEKIEQEIVSYTRKEQCLFESNAKNSYYYEFFITALYTGARCGELLALTWKDVDFEKSEIKITKTLVVESENKTRLVIQNVPKTKKSNRRIPVPNKQMLLIKTLKNKRIENNFKDNNIVFCSKVGTHIFPENIRRSMRIVLKKAKLNKQARLHILRHTYTTRLFEENVNIKAIKELLGHENVKTTLRYAHVDDEGIKKSIQVLDNLDFDK
jgi:integrase